MTFLYYDSGYLHGFDGRKFQVNGSCRIGLVQVNRETMARVAAQAALPHSLLASRMAGQDYVKSLDGLSVAFFDIETTDDEKFLLGCVNGEMFYDAGLLLKELMKYQVIVGFNSFRFDYEVLFKIAPEHFQTVRYNNFALHIIPHRINIDALFFYQVWRPWARTHKLDTLFTELDVPRTYSFDDPENKDRKKEKCREDTLILDSFYPYIKKLFAFFSQFGMDHLVYSCLPEAHFSKLRRWCLQSYMVQQGIFPSLVRKEHNVHPSFNMFCRKGYFENVNSFDVNSAYSSTAIILGSSIWKKDDFAGYQEWLRSQRGNRDTVECVKWLQNASIGDLGSQASLVYDRRVMVDIWNTFKLVMEKWVRQTKKKNIVYSYTDNIMTQLDRVPEVPDYQVSLKNSFRWIYVYNIERLLGVITDGKVFRYHFNKPMPALRLWRYVDEKTDNILLHGDHIGFLLDPRITLGELPEEAFRIVIRKTDNICRQVEYLMFWEKLKIGFNDVYLAKGGVTGDFSKVDMKQYQAMVDRYLKLYRVRKTNKIMAGRNS